jgi:xanthine/CO dehydrogenase XdhC/CoxF family maturation factor
LRKNFAERLISSARSAADLNLAGRTPEETEVSTATEIIAATTGCQAQALGAVDTPIHP